MAEATKRCPRCAGMGVIRESYTQQAGAVRMGGGFGGHGFRTMPSARGCPDCQGKGTVRA